MEKHTGLKADQAVQEPGKTRATLLARNTVLNLAGQILPLLVALPAIPYIIHRLGVDRFGILSLAWAALNISTLLDLGLGRATTKFVADYLGHGKEVLVPGVVWSSLGAQLPLGIVGGILIMVFTPLLAGRVLRVAPHLVGETETVFYLIAIFLPLVLASGPLRGTIEAIQRFDLVNYVRVPANVLMVLLPAVAVAFGIRLPGIVFLLALVRVGMTVAFLMLCFGTLPILRRKFSLKGSGVRRLLAYGGWIMVSNVTGPIMIYLDRFMIGALLSVGAVSFYAAPSELVQRTGIFPISLATALFPFYGWHGREQSELLSDVSVKSCKYILLVMMPLAIILVAFAKELLGLWLGVNFASQSSVVLQILTISCLLNALAYVPYTAVQALDHPDWKAKLDSANVFLFALLLWWLVPRTGIKGAALAKLIITAVDFVGVFLFAARLEAFSVRSASSRFLWRAIVAGGVLAVCIELVEHLRVALVFKLSFTGLLFAVYAITCWKFVVVRREKLMLFDLARLLPWRKTMGWFILKEPSADV